MSGACPMLHWKRLATAALVLALLACDGPDTPTDPGDDPDPGPGDGARLIETVLLDTGTNFLNDTPLDWSPDDGRIVFSAKLASSVWTRSIAPDSTPVLITDPAANIWSEASYTPGYLGDGRIAYYMGWSDLERVMRIMVADTTQVGAEPPPQVLRRFTGSSVGLSDGQASSPSLLSLSADGSRAVGLWHSVHLLDWGEAADPSHPATRSPDALAGATALRLSRDGARVAFVDAEGRVAWMGFQDETPRVVGAGACPSWNGDGDVLGYVAADGHAYRLLRIDSGETVSYGTSGAELRHACLSWAGDAVAYLNGDGEFLTLGWGRLEDGDSAVAR